MRSTLSILVVSASSACTQTARTPSGPIKTVELGRDQAKPVPSPAMPGVNVPAIKVDTVGYPRGWKKMVVFNTKPEHAVVKDEHGKVVLTLERSRDKGIDPASQDPVWQIDLELDTPGRYTIEDGAAKSDPFVIADHPYDRALVAGLKSFYFQRTRTALVKPYATWEGDTYERAKPSHVHKDVGWDLLDYPDKKKKWKMEGGWHDAGNYDMYVPSTAPTAYALLLAYEWAPDAFDDKSDNIPESGNGIPDVLDETKWGLVWILSMQEPNGVFRHREAVMDSSPEVPADQDTSVRWVAGPSTAATAKAVAVLALASRIYADHDAAFAARCKEAAKKGWAWLDEHPDRVIADGKGADQPLWDDEPDQTDVGARLLAAAEAWRTFRDPKALELAKTLLKEKDTEPDEIVKVSWANVSRWALWTLATDDKTPAALRAEARARILASAALMRAQWEKVDGYASVQAPVDYYWASNSQLMEKVHLLAMAAKLDPSQSWYLEAARDQIHWVLGRNPNGYSMVTRVGKGPPRFYHMEWGHREPPPPGFLIGGPNGQEMNVLAPNAPAKALLWDNPQPLRSGLPPHALWHWQETDLWDGHFAPEEDWKNGWWAVIEPDILYSSSFVLALVCVR